MKYPPCVRTVAGLLVTFVPVGAVMLSGCGSQTGYEKAFSEKTALADNSHDFGATADQAFRTVKITLVQQGFTIEQADLANGLIKAVRTFEDPKKKKYSYLVTTSVDITGAPSGQGAVVTMSAGQQTILHKDSEKYFHLLGLVPIPTGKNYQTIVTKEGNVIDKSFYNDFFGAVERNLDKLLAASAKATDAAQAQAQAQTIPAAVPLRHETVNVAATAPPAATATAAVPQAETASAAPPPANSGAQVATTTGAEPANSSAPTTAAASPAPADTPQSPGGQK